MRFQVHGNGGKRTKTDNQVPRVIFLNQVAGLLFWELAEDLAEAIGPCFLYTGQNCIRRRTVPNLQVVGAPSYERDGYRHRVLCWMRYFFFVLYRVWRQPRIALLFVVSNPPFLPLVGYLMHRLRGQSYVMLVYDIYPELAVCLGKLSEHGILTRLWRWINKVVWENAEVVFTIGEHMAIQLKSIVDSRQTRLGHVAVISNWADQDFIKPLPKSENWFAQKYGQVDKLTVLYSGNLGATHDLGTMLAAASRLRYLSDIHFLIIGEGYKQAFLEESIQRKNLVNVTLLPFQPEEVLPYSLTAGDVAVITLAEGAEKLSFPSKTFYAMASGAALLCVCAGDNDLRDLVVRHECGICVEPSDVDGFIHAVEKFHYDREFLAYSRRNARKAMETYYTRRNTKRYLDVLGKLR